jgi:acetyl esterase/lipase
MKKSYVALRAVGWHAFVLIGLLTASVGGCAQTQIGMQVPIALWPGGAPQAQGTADADIPQLIPFLPARVRTTTGVLVIPGGGYVGLSLPTEGYEVAQFLNAAGIPAFVLKYRLAPRYRYPAQLQDGQRALRYLRANAAQYKLKLIGVAGFSAGGHLASEMGTAFDPGDANAKDPVDRAGSRPDFMILGYPVIGTAGFAAEGSLRNIDPDPTHPANIAKPGVVTSAAMDPKLVELLSTNLHVTRQTPPAFLVCADDDRSVFSDNSVEFYLALHRAGVAAELHIYEHGRHGFGLAAWDPVDSTWTGRMLDWMRINGFLEAPRQ